MKNYLSEWHYCKTCLWFVGLVFDTETQKFYSIGSQDMLNIALQKKGVELIKIFNDDKN
jgi:hypothetical protein